MLVYKGIQELVYHYSHSHQSYLGEFKSKLNASVCLCPCNMKGKSCLNRYSQWQLAILLGHTLGRVRGTWALPPTSHACLGGGVPWMALWPIWHVTQVGSGLFKERQVAAGAGSTGVSGRLGSRGQAPAGLRETDRVTPAHQSQPCLARRLMCSANRPRPWPWGGGEWRQQKTLRCSNQAFIYDCT